MSDLATNGLGTTRESSASAVSWPAVFAGATVAIALTLVLFTLGAGFGFAAASPWGGPSPVAASAMTGIWLIVTQWLSSLVGGYLTGRLRVKWHGTHTDEVFFRDTAHGFLTWSVATVVIAGISARAASSTAGVAAQVAAEIAAQAKAPISPEGAAMAADAARKAASAAAIVTAVSMLVGAFIASAAAALGGNLRDEHV